MTGVIFSSRAIADFHDILTLRHSLAGDNVAERLRGRFLDVFRAIGEHPLAGSRRPDLTTRKTYRFWIAENYWVVYRPRQKSPSIIVRIIDARRDVLRVLG